MITFIADSLYYIFIVWFLYGFYDIYTDSTLSPAMKNIGYLIDGASLLFILLNLFVNAKHLGFFYFLLGFALLIWYMWYTPKDMVDPGYTDFQRFLYLTVDYSMIFCILGASMSWTAFKKITMAQGYMNLGDFFQLIYHAF